MPTLIAMMSAVPEPSAESLAKVRWDALSKEERAKQFSALLRARGLSQSSLQKRLGVSFPTVNKWYLAKTPISWARWLSICHACEVSPDWQPPPEEDVPQPQ